MNEMPELQTALLDLLYETRNADLKLITGGGYGIYLKRKYVRESGAQTLLREWPEARSTNDLDLFLRPELLIDSAQLKPLAAALPRLGYKVIKGAEKYQFVRPGPSGDEQGAIKIDFLTGPRSSFNDASVKVDERRVRPKQSVNLHAHPTDEAITLEVEMLPLDISGPTSSGPIHHGKIYLPHPFTFALMKLFAFRDRREDTNKEFGRYHALDLYSILAMMTEPEWETALKLSNEHRQSPKVLEAARIVDSHFSTLTSEGVLRIRESPYYLPTLQLQEFCSAIRSLFPNTADEASPK